MTRKINVVKTCDFDHFVANVTVQVTYISDIIFFLRKPLHCATLVKYAHSTITCATVAREIIVVVTCGLNRFAAISPVHVTYNWDLVFCPRKPQLPSTSGYYYSSRYKRHSHLRLQRFCIICYRPGTCISYFTFRAPKRLLLTW